MMDNNPEHSKRLSSAALLPTKTVSLEELDQIHDFHKNKHA